MNVLNVMKFNDRPVAVFHSNTCAVFACVTGLIFNECVYLIAVDAVMQVVRVKSSCING